MINSFVGPCRFLSNFYPSEITYEGITYPTVEHAFQASKTTILLSIVLPVYILSFVLLRPSTNIFSMLPTFLSFSS